eukprot:m.1069677 g.1069677  ORF g.1069677 m.1069677 type:complete len:92 (-) comp24231_c0_seq9:529-804(-)
MADLYQCDAPWSHLQMFTRAASLAITFSLTGRSIESAATCRSASGGSGMRSPRIGGGVGKCSNLPILVIELLCHAVLLHVTCGTTHKRGCR